MRLQNIILLFVTVFALGACSHGSHKHHSCCSAKAEAAACDGKECSMKEKCKKCGKKGKRGKKAKKAEAAKESAAEAKSGDSEVSKD